MGLVMQIPRVQNEIAVLYVYCSIMVRLVNGVVRHVKSSSLSRRVSRVKWQTHNEEANSYPNP